MGVPSGVFQLPARRATRAARSARALFAIIAAAAALAACAGSRKPPRELERSRAPQDGGPGIVAQTGSARCATCHAREAREWQGSYHRKAYTDETFQRSLAREEPADRAFCTHCHAPAGEPQEVAVGCLSCHGSMVNHERDVRAAHTSRTGAAQQAQARAQQACAGCHQFTVDPLRDGRADLIQKTSDEHAHSPFANVTCAGCHMPRREDGHRDHAFVGGHSLGALRTSIHVAASRARKDNVHIRIRSEAGHAFPTGDMFRRARLLVFAESSDGAVLESYERHFGRTWGFVRGGPQEGKRSELSDTRIRQSFEEDFAIPAHTSRVRYVLLYERILAMPSNGSVVFESSDAIAEGTL